MGFKKSLNILHDHHTVAAEDYLYFCKLATIFQIYIRELNICFMLLLYEALLQQFLKTNLSFFTSCSFFKASGDSFCKNNAHIQST